MQRKDLKLIKVKRILVVYRELERLKVNHAASMEIMEYQFGISSRWIEEILRRYNLDEFNDVELRHADIDMAFIDKYVDKLRKAAKKERNQLELLA